MGWSAEARRAAAEARRMRRQLGSAEKYAEWKASRGAKPEKTSVSAALKPEKPKLTPRDAEHLGSKFPDLHDEKFMSALARGRAVPDESKLKKLASVQAARDMPDESIISHYRGSNVFIRRGHTPQDVAKFRDNYRKGVPIPLFAAPPGTPIAMYRGNTGDELHPDILGTVTQHLTRTPEGLSKPVTYVQIRDKEGNMYEYPAMMGSGTRSPHVVHPSFAAIKPIKKRMSHVPTIGFGYPNFHTGDKAGPSDAPDDLVRLAKSIQRAIAFQRAVEARNARKAGK